MTDVSAIAAALFGLLAILLMLMPGGKYYARMIGTGKKELPKWWGRLWFLGFAAVMFYLALNHFLGKK